MGLSPDPSYRTAVCMHECLEALRDRERHGKPYDGGSYEQPREWKRRIDVVLEARERADAERDAEEEAERKRKQADSEEAGPDSDEALTM